jgi:hypothetical protein
VSYLVATRGNYPFPWPSVMRFGPRSWKSPGDQSGNVSGSPSPSTPAAATLLPSLIAHASGLLGFGQADGSGQSQQVLAQQLAAAAAASGGGTTGAVGTPGSGGNPSAPATITNVYGNAVDCSNWLTYALNFECWGYSLSSWQQMNAIATAAGSSITASPPTPPAPTNLTIVPSSGEEATSTVDALLNQQMASWQSQNQANMNQAAISLQNLVTTTPEASGINWSWVLVGIAVVFGLFMVTR